MNIVVGYPGNEISLKKVTDFLREHEKERVSETILKGIEKGPVGGEAIIVTKDGSHISYVVNASVLSDAQDDMNEVLIAAERTVDLTRGLLVRIIREGIQFTVELSDRPLIVLAGVGQMNKRERAEDNQSRLELLVRLFHQDALLMME